ncbi:Minf_1886 family protein [Persicirhabdus sediminis]|uniref:Uncharacterized protein n=1 Tax=Persicirhabdus sediminis TaxID=454144 RepID=A0A8J7MDB2_9BACT|nr:Minf_1886 family protein [Persicirhabdus sediminis]MBK1791106.1 hypothetical protein [Persicirhabdus sediminis]
MQPSHFEDAVIELCMRQRLFNPGAYMFLKDALDHTVEKAQEQSEGPARHVSAEELMLGWRDLALEKFGPMASTMMREWGVSKCSDIGVMVFALIEAKIFGKQDSDNQADFIELYNFDDAFRGPFLPKNIRKTVEVNAIL